MLHRTYHRAHPQPKPVVFFDSNIHHEHKSLSIPHSPFSKKKNEYLFFCSFSAQITKYWPHSSLFIHAIKSWTNQLGRKKKKEAASAMSPSNSYHIWLQTLAIVLVVSATKGMFTRPRPPLARGVRTHAKWVCCLRLWEGMNQPMCEQST